MQRDKKTVMITTTGCVDCYVDVKILKDYFADIYHYDVTDNYSKADIIMILGCIATQYVEDDTRALIDYITTQKREDAELVVLGCISKVRPEFTPSQERTTLPLDEIHDLLQQGDLTNPVVPYSPDSFVEADFFQAKKERKLQAFQQYAESAPKPYRNRLAAVAYQKIFEIFRHYTDFMGTKISPCSGRSALLRISLGCKNYCSYCAIKRARGQVRSKPLPQLMDQVHQILAAGYTDIVLTGTNIGDYGKDLGLDLLDLLDRLVHLEAPLRIRMRNLHPKWVIANIDEFLKLLGSGKFLFVASPIQSGNDRILKLMNRGYGAEEFLAGMREIHRRCPAVILETHVIVGFPGETEAEFEDSLRIIDEEIFDHIVINRYTERPGTKAASFMDKNPEKVIWARYKRMLLKKLVSRPLRQLKALYRLNYGSY